MAHEEVSPDIPDSQFNLPDCASASDHRRGTGTTESGEQGDDRLLLPETDDLAGQKTRVASNDVIPLKTSRSCAALGALVSSGTPSSRFNRARLLQTA
jgi:hypothetical protein